MIRFFLLISLLVLVSCKNENECDLPINWNLKKAGTLFRDKAAGAVDFIFLSPTSILVANYPEKGSETAPLQIYTKTGDEWVYDSKASAQLPPTYHARQMVLEDIDGDNQPEVVIADHGYDAPPYPGGFPIILRQVNGQWVNEPTSKALGSDFTFNAAVLTLPGGKKAVYKANVFGKSPVFFSHKKGKWTDETASLPSELHPHQLCLMTTLKADYNLDGKNDLYLGGCDMKVGRDDNTHDRMLFLDKDKWTLAPTNAFPARPMNSSWGTVYVKLTDWNKDSKPDILFASHDFGYTTWKVGVYVNESTPENFKFSHVDIPLLPEKDTEGYVNSLEDFEVPGIGHAILAEFRSVIRSKGKVLPSTFARFAVNQDGKISDQTACVPKELRPGLFRALKVPGDEGSILVLPYHGNIYSIKPQKSDGI